MTLDSWLVRCTPLEVTRNYLSHCFKVYRPINYSNQFQMMTVSLASKLAIIAGHCRIIDSRERVSIEQ